MPLKTTTSNFLNNIFTQSNVIGVQESTNNNFCTVFGNASLLTALYLKEKQYCIFCPLWQSRESKIFKILILTKFRPTNSAKNETNKDNEIDYKINGFFFLRLSLHALPSLKLTGAYNLPLT